MKISESMAESIFVMHLKRELDFRQLRAEKPDMKHAVEVAEANTILTIENLSGGGA